MNRNVQIRELIDRHVREFGLEEGRMPIYDGITNPISYDNAPLKLLFINKEPYDVEKNDKIGKGGWDHTEYLNDNDASIITDVFTHQRVSKITTCLLRGFSLDQYNDGSFTWEMALEDFKKIAWINVGKFPAPGISTTSDPRLLKAYNYWSPVLKEEIEIINPDIMIFGNTFKVFEEDIKDKLEYLGKSGITKAYRDAKGRLYIDTYHPAVRPCTISEEDYINSIIKVIKKFNKES